MIISKWVFVFHLYRGEGDIVKGKAEKEFRRAQRRRRVGNRRLLRILAYTWRSLKERRRSSRGMVHEE